MKAVIIFSGGIDSTVMLTEQVKTMGKDNVKALFFDYGSKHNERELEAAKKITELLSVPMEIVHIGSLNRLLASDLLQTEKDVVQPGSTDERKRVFIPFRNGIMLSVAVGYADSIDYNQVYIGTHRHVDPTQTYPDCTRNFINCFSAASFEGTYRNVTVMAPLSAVTKPGIIKMGLAIGAPLQLTYSCYNGRELQCGKCGTCLDRIKGFRALGMFDPGKFEISIDGIK